jgi:hypothetical protein
LDSTVGYKESNLGYSECGDEYQEAAESWVQCVPVDFHFGVIWRVLLRVGICGSDVIGSEVGSGFLVAF